MRTLARMVRVSYMSRKKITFLDNGQIEIIWVDNDSGEIFFAKDDEADWGLQVLEINNRPHKIDVF